VLVHGRTSTRAGQGSRVGLDGGGVGGKLGVVLGEGMEGYGEAEIRRMRRKGHV